MEKNSLHIKHFSPAWFAMIMGLGAFANASYMIGAKVVGISVFWVNIVMFFLLSVPFIIRFVVYFEDVKRDIFSPYTIAFYPTFAVGMLVLAGGAMLMKPFSGYIEFAFLMYIVGSLLVLAFASIIGYAMFVSDGVDLKHANYSWLIPPVAAVVVPMVGSSLVPYAGSYAKLLALINVMYFSIGFFLYIFVGSIIFHRMVTHSLPSSSVAPTIWISLGPIGVSAIDMLGFTKALYPLGITIGMAPALMIWGFGIWCYVVSVLITIHYWKNTGIPYGLGWWAYIFPLGAYTIATIYLAKVMSCPFAMYIAWILYITLVINLLMTLKNMYMFLWKK